MLFDEGGAAGNHGFVGEGSWLGGWSDGRTDELMMMAGGGGEGAVSFRQIGRGPNAGRSRWPTKGGDPDTACMLYSLSRLFPS